MYRPAMHSVEQARTQIQAAMPRLPAERVDLTEAHHRILAADVVAERDLPGFDNSAMDGFAVRAADLPATLPVLGHVAAGPGGPVALAAGAAVRIMTGAVMPDGADAVVMLEDAEASADGARVTLPACPAGAHLRRRGEDVAAGAIAVPAGTELGPGPLAVLAALGLGTVVVARQPRVAILATGDELVPVDVAPGPGQLVDSSAHMLAAQIAAAGGLPFYLGIVGDQRAAVTALLRRTASYDVVVTTGGVSAGDHDHVRAALVDAGGSLDLWKVAMRPGKPLAFGQVEGRPMFGLPGNPVSSFVAFELFVRPALRAMMGATTTERRRVPVRLASAQPKTAGRAAFLRARLVTDGDHLVAIPHGKQGSAMLSSLIGADALLELPADASDLPAGAPATALLLDPS